MRLAVLAAWPLLLFAQSFPHALELQRAGDLEGAVREYQGVLAADPGRFDARGNLGAVLSQLGRYAEAIEQYDAALKTAPPEAAMHLRMNLGLAYYKAFRISEAAREFTVVHAAHPEFVNATLLLADCDLRLGENSKVVELLGPLETAQPGNRAVTYMLGMAYLRDGQVPQGQRRIDLILRDGDSAEGRFLLAVAMFSAGDFPRAVKAFARAVDLNSALPSLQSYYGRALLNTGDADGAAGAFRKELAANPNDFEANLGLGQILAQRGKREEAQAYLQRAAVLRPGVRINEGAPTAGDDPGVAGGAEAPDFAELKLADDRGRRPVVLVFGSYTCPQFRGSAAAIEAMAEKYRDRARFVLVYIREAHVGEQWQSTINQREGVALEPARDLSEKKAHASLCVRKLNLKFPAVTDGMDGRMEAAYKAWPSRVYVVGRDGRVAFDTRLGEAHFDAAAFEKAIQTSLAK